MSKVLLRLIINSVKVVLCLIVFFLYIFGPRLMSVGPWMDFIFIVSVLISFRFYVLKNKRIPKIILVFSPIILVCIYSLISIAEYEASSFKDYFRFIFKPVRIIVTVLAGFALVNMLKKSNSLAESKTVYTYIFFSIVIHAMIMCYQLFDPSFKDWVYSYTTTGEFRASYDYNFRMGGLSGGTGGAVLSIVQSLGILLLPSLMNKTSLFFKLLYLCGGLLIFSSVLICGRSGIYVILLFLPLLIYLLGNKRSFSFWLKIISYVAVCLFLVIGLFTVYDIVEAESPLYYALTRSLDTFLAARKSGTYDDETTAILIEHILLPKDLGTWLFGNGEHIVNTQFNRTLHSDIGYIRDLWSLGILMSVLYWIPIFLFTLLSFNLRNKYKAAVLLFILSLVMLFFHLKESYLYVRMFLSIYSLILSLLFLEIKNQRKNAT